jgi:hypothetical protein
MGYAIVRALRLSDQVGRALRASLEDRTKPLFIEAWLVSQFNPTASRQDKRGRIIIISDIPWTIICWRIVPALASNLLLFALDDNQPVVEFRADMYQVVDLVADEAILRNIGAVDRNVR